MRNVDIDFETGYEYVKISIRTEKHEYAITIWRSMFGPPPATITIDGYSFYTRNKLETYLNAIMSGDENKIEYMKKLAKTGLNADKHCHFDEKRLMEAYMMKKIIMMQISLNLLIFYS